MQESRFQGAFDPWGEAQRRVKFAKYVTPEQMKKAMAAGLNPIQAMPSSYQFKRKLESDIGEYLIKHLRGLPDFGTSSGSESQLWMQ